jgi:hypothetical protein
VSQLFRQALPNDNQNNFPRWLVAANPHTTVSFDRPTSIGAGRLEQIVRFEQMIASEEKVRLNRAFSPDNVAGAIDRLQSQRQQVFHT